jgi:hypothetical protein
MRSYTLGAAAALAVSLALPLTAQQQSVAIDDDEITITGCITAMTMSVPAPERPEILLWSRGDIMLAGVAATSDDDRSPATERLASRVFYWLDDDNTLANHVGQRVQVRGELEDFEEGEIEIERDGDYAEIELELDGKEEEARVPISWLGPGGPDRDVNVEFVARRIDVEDVRVLGPCGGGL